jgi:hypothetical protein
MRGTGEGNDFSYEVSLSYFLDFFNTPYSRWLDECLGIETRKDRITLAEGLCDLGRGDSLVEGRHDGGGEAYRAPFTPLP